MNGKRSVSSFIGSSTYCWICYSSNHATLNNPLLKEDAYFVKAHNRNYEALFWLEGNYQRQMQYLVSRHSLPPQERQGQQNHILVITTGAIPDIRHVMVVD